MVHYLHTMKYGLTNSDGGGLFCAEHESKPLHRRLTSSVRAALMSSTPEVYDAGLTALAQLGAAIGADLTPHLKLVSGGTHMYCRYQLKLISFHLLHSMQWRRAGSVLNVRRLTAVARTLMMQRSIPMQSSILPVNITCILSAIIIVHSVSNITVRM